MRHVANYIPDSACSKLARIDEAPQPCILLAARLLQGSHPEAGNLGAHLKGTPEWRDG
jgi:hypothetical protein